MGGGKGETLSLMLWCLLQYYVAAREFRCWEKRRNRKRRVFASMCICVRRVICSAKIKSSRIFFILEFGCLVCDPQVVHDFFRFSWNSQNSMEMLDFDDGSLTSYFSQLSDNPEKPDISLTKLSAVIVMIDKIRDCRFGIDHSGPTGFNRGGHR